jgi:hypothetical protein
MASQGRMIVTLDASILVAPPSGPPARPGSWSMPWVDPDHIIALSHFILGRVSRVLSYPRMQALYRLNAEEIEDHVRLLQSVSCIVEPASGLPVVLSDPDDDPVHTPPGRRRRRSMCQIPGFLCSQRRGLCGRQDMELMDETKVPTFNDPCDLPPPAPPASRRKHRSPPETAAAAYAASSTAGQRALDHFESRVLSPRQALRARREQDFGGGEFMRQSAKLLAEMIRVALWQPRGAALVARHQIIGLPSFDKASRKSSVD